MLEPTTTWNGLRTLWRYLLASIVANLVWEFLQFPLYTSWSTGTAYQIALMVLHCTMGDVLVALVAVVAALLAVGSPLWPERRFAAVTMGTVAVSVLITIGVEYLSTVVWHFWSYTEAMPRLPWLGTGLSPLAQWMILPPLALIWARRRRMTAASIPS